MHIKLNDIIATGTAKFQVVKIATSKDIDNLNARINNYLPLSGGTMTPLAQIKKDVTSISWQQGRDYALTALKDSDGYNALTSIKTTNGSWEIGHYNSSGWSDNLLFNYIKDTTYNGTNNVDAQVKFTQQGGIMLQSHVLLNYNSANGCLEITVS